MLPQPAGAGTRPARCRPSRGACARASCLSRFGRTPARVTTVSAEAGASGRIVLTFRAAASDGTSAPAAHTYLIKQSLSPIRTARDFSRAPALCKSACVFSVTKLNAEAKLEVTGLRRNRTYYYSVAARDNVSKRPGPRSRTASARTR